MARTACHALRILSRARGATAVDWIPAPTLPISAILVAVVEVSGFERSAESRIRFGGNRPHTPAGRLHGNGSDRGRTVHDATAATTLAPMPSSVSVTNTA